MGGSGCGEPGVREMAEADSEYRDFNVILFPHCDITCTFNAATEPSCETLLRSILSMDHIDFAACRQKEASPPAYLQPQLSYHDAEA